ncbi:MAG: cell wall metabolism sensor histidine kinase WalK, partial [Candidatus Omnitrophica bacterium]|nr:cell wall metabolism sensor histidine kinase WalK [Candidatus Omnitrophota bacterium]
MRINIHYKITLIFGIILAFILSGIYLYLDKSMREHTYQRIRTDLKKQISLVGSYLEEDFIQNIKSYELDKIADKIGKNLELRVTIINLDGRVFGDSELDGDELIGVENHLHRLEVQQALKSEIGESRRFSTTVKKDMLYIATVYGKNKTPGIIRVAMPLLEIELISDRVKKILVASLLVAFILAIVISFLASVFISKPVREISLITQDAAQGNFSKRVLIASNDEMGDLGKAFNHMSEQIKLKLQEVNLSKSRLEA